MSTCLYDYINLRPNRVILTFATHEEITVAQRKWADVTCSRKGTASFTACAFREVFGCARVGSPTFWHWISVTVAVLPPSSVDSEKVTPRRARRVSSSAACARAQASRGASARGRSRSRPETAEQFARFPSRAFPAAGGVRTSSLHCSANSGGAEGWAAIQPRWARAFQRRRAKLLPLAAHRTVLEMSTKRTTSHSS